MLGGVSYAKPKYSRTRYDEAGSILSARSASKANLDQASAIEAVGDWRMSHVFPMEAATIALDQTLQKASTTALTSRRIKRLESVELKLRHNRDMRLTQMQDIGGCRAIIYGGSAGQINHVAQSLRTGLDPFCRDNFSFDRMRDYIASPKLDGYRGVHVILSYRGPEKSYEGLKIEIQVRTKIQHMWATAVEICEFFTQKKLKSKEKTADKMWQRFFSLTSSYFASLEEMSPVPNTPPDRSDLIAEIKDIDSKIKALVAFPTWTASFASIPRDRGFYYFILDLNANDRCLTIHPFTREYLPDAERKYIEIENASENDLARQVVLVSVESFGMLGDAYPNYFVDSSAFCSTLEAALR